MDFLNRGTNVKKLNFLNFFNIYKFLIFEVKIFF